MASSSRHKSRNPAVLEEQRIRAVRMIVERGLSEHEVARRLGISQGGVSMWYSAYRDGGNSYDVLRRKKHTGRPVKLKDRQLHQIPAILQRGAEHYGFATDLWTAERVAKIIRDRYHVSYSETQTVRILHKLGFTWQKPEGTAREYDEGSVKEWVLHVLPQVKKS